MCALNTCKKQLLNWRFCLTATSLHECLFPCKASLILGVNTITAQKPIIVVFLQELRVGIESASSVRWVSFFYYYCHYRAPCTTSPYHVGEHGSLRVIGAKGFSYTSYTTINETFELNSFQLTLGKFKALKIFHFQLWVRDRVQQRMVSTNCRRHSLGRTLVLSWLSLTSVSISLEIIQFFFCISSVCSIYPAQITSTESYQKLLGFFHTKITTISMEEMFLEQLIQLDYP